MRRACAIVGLLMLLAPARARAQSASASGSMGVGAFDARLATVFDLGFDVAGPSYALGFGARMRVVDNEFRRADWDEPSELARILRYLIYQREEDVQVTAVAGELGGARIGHGSVWSGFTSGVEIDHGHLGAHVRLGRGRLGVEAAVDDVVAPRLVGARVGWELLDSLGVAVSASADLSAPSMDGSAALPFVGLDLDYQVQSGRLGLRAYWDLVAVIGLAAGAHLGVEASLESEPARVTLGVEGRSGTASYFPGWFGPLYAAHRPQRLDRARRGMMRGLGHQLRGAVKLHGFGEASVSYAERAGLPALWVGRLSLPHTSVVQAAGWAALEPRGAKAAAFEARVPVRGNLFVGGDVARLYRHEMSMPVPVWVVTASVGGVLGE